MIRYNTERIEEIIRDIAQECLLPRFRKFGSAEIQTKQDGSFVTIADKETEDRLSQRLFAELPGSVCVGEEACTDNPGLLHALQGDDPVWIIDALDGTSNFINGNNEFGIIVALAHGDETVAAWIHDPTTQAFVTAERGAGAFCGERRLRVLSTPLQPSEMEGVVSDNLHKYSIQHFGGVEKLRSGAHEYPRLVMPNAFGRQKRQVHFRLKTYIFSWDDAAGVLIHQEANGCALCWDSTPYRPSVRANGLILAPDRGTWTQIHSRFRAVLPPSVLGVYPPVALSL